MDHRLTYLPGFIILRRTVERSFQHTEAGATIHYYRHGYSKLGNTETSINLQNLPRSKPCKLSL